MKSSRTCDQPARQRLREVARCGRPAGSDEAGDGILKPEHYGRIVLMAAQAQRLLAGMSPGDAFA